MNYSTMLATRIDQAHHALDEYLDKLGLDFNTPEFATRCNYEYIKSVDSMTFTFKAHMAPPDGLVFHVIVGIERGLTKTLAVVVNAGFILHKVDFTGVFPPGNEATEAAKNLLSGTLTAKEFLSQVRNVTPYG